MLLLAILLSATPLRPVLITVDDLPLTGPMRNASDSEKSKLHDGMLAALKKHQIQALAFVTWNNLTVADEALLQRWVAAGHELGNHSSTHLNYNKTDIAAYWDDVEKARVQLARLGKVRFFRFPFLREGDTIEKLRAGRAYLQKSGQRNVGVTIDNQDWSFEERLAAAKTETEKRLLHEDYQAALRVAVRLHEARGDDLLGRQSPQILLLHAGAMGAAEWDALFQWLEETGHRFATADEVLADPVFSLPHEYVARYGSGIFDRLLDKEDREYAEQKVKRLLEGQVKAWNAGDIDGFCSVYAEDAVFLSPSGLTKGRAELIARYKKRYPNKAAMGTLSLTVLDVRLGKGVEVTPFGDAVPSDVHSVSIAAAWSLSYPAKPTAKGTTLLTLQPHGESFVIVQDASM
jgi:peptidoglycan/xylan/chitin deacetylase (PgdA/CDA1 family)